MAISPIGINAYRAAMGQSSLGNASGAQGVQNKVAEAFGTSGSHKTSFVDSLKSSLADVNAEQVKKDQMVASFTTGENQNVHELMIQLQKAGLAMSMTSTVRNKVMDMYKELVKMPF
jgi:flagellar hook-basal body complex protein FliE